MADRIRAFDWSTTPLGPIGGWPHSLATAVDLILASAQPACIGWGADLTALYNDGYVPIAGDKHPAALGLPYRLIWPEIWDDVRRFAEAVLSGDTPSHVDQPVPLARRPGQFTLSWTPLRNDHGAVAGIYCAAVETTQRVLADREREPREPRDGHEHRMFLLTLSDELAELNDPVDIEQAASRLLGEHLGALRVGYGEVTGDELVIRADYANGVPSLAGRYPIDAFGPSLAGIHRRGGTIVLRDAGSDPSLTDTERQEYRGLGVAAHVTVAIRKAGRPVISMGVQSDRPRDWNDAEIALIHDVADRTWAAIGRAQIDQAMRDAEEGRAFLLELSDALRPLTNPLDIQQAAMKLLAERFDVMRAGYLDVDPDGETMTMAAKFERDAEPVPDRIRLSDYGPDLAAAFRAGQTRYVCDADAEAETDKERVAHRALGIRAWIIAPLVKDGRLIAIVGVVSRPPRDWTPVQIQLVTDLAERTWDAVQRARSEQALRASEERLQTLVEGVPQLVWRASDGGHWTWASPQWTDFTGQAEIDSHGWGWLDPVHPDDRETVTDIWAGATERGEFHADYRICHAREGRYRWFQTRATPVRDDDGRICEWLGTSTDVDDLRVLQRRQETLLAELQHRVRNILAVTRSIISRSDDGERSTADYVQHLRGRIAALARTQVLLTRAAGADVSLTGLIHDELVAQAAPAEKVTLNGSDVALSPKIAEVLTLAVHELATNAAKYGALSHAEGRIAVSWHVERRRNQDWLALRWKETGVPILATAPARQGFGTELISKRIPYELRGAGSIAMTAGGIESRIAFPLSTGNSILQTDAGVR